MIGVMMRRQEHVDAIEGRRRRLDPAPQRGVRLPEAARALPEQGVDRVRAGGRVDDDALVAHPDDGRRHPIPRAPARRRNLTDTVSVVCTTAS